MTTPLDPMRLLNTGPVAGQPPVAPGTQATTPDGRTFSDVLRDFVQQADQAQHQAEDAIGAVQRGDVDNLHRVMLAQSQAQLSLKLAVEVRNKLVDAYKDVMRTQF